MPIVISLFLVGLLASGAKAAAYFSLADSDVVGLKDTITGMANTMAPIYLLIFAISIAIAYMLGKRKGTK